MIYWDASRVDESHRLLVGIAGPPASGKSTLGPLVVNALNTEDDEIAVLIGLDGWHLSRDTLSKADDPEYAFARRGAHFTFDANGYVAFVRQLREPVRLDSAVVWAPSFSHSIKDPVEHAVSITPRHKIIVVEGLYSFLGIEPWREAAELLDERWYITVDEDVAFERLITRHVQTGVAPDKESAINRAKENDIPSQ